MKKSRRNFLKNSFVAGASASLTACTPINAQSAASSLQNRYAVLDKVLKEPIFKKELFPDPNDGVFYIEVDLIHQNQAALLKIWDMQGQLLWSQ